MKKDVLKELPEKIETKFVTELSEEQKKLYLSYLETYRGEFGEEFETGQFSHAKFQILAALTRLRQICCHPGTFIENYEGESGKLELFLQILPDLIANGHRILVFSQFTSMLEILKEALTEAEIPFFYLCGATKPAERQDYVKRFNGGEGDLFLISLKAGGTGLNLTGADIVIHYDPWWNVAAQNQAADRTHRIGQEKTVTVYKLISRGTIEEKILALQEAKQALADDIITADLSGSDLSREALIDILKA
jgi:SNF2 family DNA or RNA helicase